MKRDIEKRLSALEKVLPPVYPPASSERLGELLHSFVEALGGRQEHESWANAAARLMGIRTTEFKASLLDGTFAARFSNAIEVHKAEILASQDAPDIH